MNAEEHFFDFAAEVCLTKHLGGLEATDRLIELCHIGPDSHVLDIGCGAGATACYLAGRVGCRVTGVDILPRMVERSRQRAAKEGLTDRTEFRVADAQRLPFDARTFDAVITESVMAFPDDKAQAMAECVRVTRPGGYVGLNESTWLRVPPPPEVVAWARQDVGAAVEPLTAEAWSALLLGAGLEEITVQVSPIEARDEVRGLMQRYGCLGMLGVYGRMLRLYLTNPAYRRFVAGARQQGIVPEDLTSYFGYGLYVGRKSSNSWGNHG